MNPAEGRLLTPAGYLRGVDLVADLERQVADIRAVLDMLAGQVDRYDRALIDAERNLVAYRKAVYGVLS